MEKDNKTTPTKGVDRKFLEEFATRMNVTPEQIIANDRTRVISEIRHLYCYMRRELYDEVTFVQIAREIERTPETVFHSHRLIKGLLEIGYKKIIPMWELVKDIPESA